MKKTYFITLCLCLPFFAFSQIDTNVLVIDYQLDKVAPQNGKVIKDISVKRTENRTFVQLMRQVRDSTKTYGGNCFLITAYDTSKAATLDIRTFKPFDYMQGRIFLIDDDEKLVLQKAIIENHRIRDSLKVNYTSKDFELAVGLNFMPFDLKQNEGFISEHEGNFEAFVDLSVAINRTWKHPRNRNANVKLGLGLSRTYLGFYPLITLKEANIADIDTVRVGEIGNWEYQLMIPMSISIVEPNLIEDGTGIKLIMGVEYRHRIYHINTDNILTENYDFAQNIGTVVEDKLLTKLTNEHYNQLISPYSLIGHVGLGVTIHEGVGFGVQYSRFIIPPFASGQELDKNFGVNFFIEMQLFNMKK